LLRLLIGRHRAVIDPGRAPRLILCANSSGRGNWRGDLDAILLTHIHWTRRRYGALVRENPARRVRHSKGAPQ